MLNMAPAEVERSLIREIWHSDRVESGDAKEYRIGRIEAAVVSHGPITEVEFSGRDLRFRVQRDGFTISEEGDFKKGRIRVFLKGGRDLLEVREKETGAEAILKVTNKEV